MSQSGHSCSPHGMLCRLQAPAAADDGGERDAHVAHAQEPGAARPRVVVLRARRRRGARVDHAALPRQGAGLPGAPLILTQKTGVVFNVSPKRSTQGVEVSAKQMGRRCRVTNPMYAAHLWLHLWQANGVPMAVMLPHARPGNASLCRSRDSWLGCRFRYHDAALICAQMRVRGHAESISSYARWLRRSTCCTWCTSGTRATACARCPVCR